MDDEAEEDERRETAERIRQALKRPRPPTSSFTCTYHMGGHFYQPQASG
jgi:hypothetical protein